MVRQFEELSNNAWPALQTMQYDGWILRFANGVTKRSNAVSMLYPSTIDPGEKISFCERLYQSQNITPCFKITGETCPAEMDQRLAARGYFIHSYISFQVMDITGISRETHQDICLEADLNPRWIDDFIRLNDFVPARKATYIGIMEQLRLPKCLLSIERDQKTVAVGLGVAEGRFLGLFDIVVEKSLRNTGLGRLVVENILSWGRKRGTDTAYLQVLTDNIPAIRLYEKIGFREAYQYWYRMKK